MALELFTQDNRGVSTVVGYLTNLSVLVLVVSAISLIGTSQFETVREQNAQNEFEGLTQQVALEVQVIDQVNRAGASSSASISRSVDYPDRISGFNYQIGVTNERNNGNYYQYDVIVTFQNDITVVAPVESQTPIVTDKFVTGGSFNVIRPQPTGSNPLCEQYDSDNDGDISDLTTTDDPDECKITLEERN